MRALVYGAGAAGGIHAHILAERGWEVGVCDTNMAKARLLADMVRGSAERDGVGEWDLAVVATPPPTHYRLVADEARRGRMVVCEKPLCLRPQEAWNLAHEVAAGQWEVYVAESQAYAGEDGLDVLRMRDRVTAGEFGPEVSWWVRAMTAFRPQEWALKLNVGGGAFIEGGVHVLTLGRIVFGAACKWHGSFRSLQRQTGPDSGTLIVEYAKGHRLTMQLAWGTEGCFEGLCEPLGGGAGLFGAVACEPWWPPDDHRKMWAHLERCMNGEAEPVATLRHAAGAVQDAWNCYAAGGIAWPEEW